MFTPNSDSMTFEPQLGRSVSIDHAAQLMNVSRRTVYNRIRDGRLQTIRTRCRGMPSTFAASAAATRPPMHSRRRSARVRCVSSGR